MSSFCVFDEARRLQSVLESCRRKAVRVRGRWGGFSLGSWIARLLQVFLVELGHAVGGRASIIGTWMRCMFMQVPGSGAERFDMIDGSQHRGRRACAWLRPWRRAAGAGGQ